MENAKLNLLEEFLLIALDDDKGQFVTSSTHLHYGFAGAILLELAIRGKIAIEDERVKLKESTYEKEVVLNKAIDFIKNDEKSSVKDCIHHLAKKANELKQDTLQRLINKGILKKEEHKILWLIPNDKYPTTDLTPESKVRQRLDDVMLHGAKADAHDVMLLSLIDVSDLTKEAFRSKADYKKVKKEIKEVTKDVQVSGVVNKSIREIQAAIMLAITTSIVVSTVVSN